jgi:hypothetical protein
MYVDIMYVRMYIQMYNCIILDLSCFKSLVCNVLRLKLALSIRNFKLSLQ